MRTIQCGDNTHITLISVGYSIEVAEFAVGGDHDIVVAKELKDNYIKVEPSVICHDGESIQVCI